jgi:hypothetical protein
MEEIIDFDTIISQQTTVNNKYWATFDNRTGKVLGIYPEDSLIPSNNKIEIDNSVVDDINEGEILLSNCIVDIASHEFRILSNQPISNSKNLFHRIIEKQWSTALKHDIYINYYIADNTLTVAMSERLGGTVPCLKSNSVKQTIWTDDVRLTLAITDYNDPNIIYYLITVNLSELKGQTKTIKDIKPPSQFSIFTRKLFKNYVLEII